MWERLPQIEEAVPAPVPVPIWGAPVEMLLQLAEELGCHSLTVESDSMEVVEAVLNPFDFRGTGAVIIDDCRQLLALLGMATIKHCPREANGAAHALARRGASQGLREVLLDEPPSFLISIRHIKYSFPQKTCVQHRMPGCTHGFFLRIILTF